MAKACTHVSHTISQPMSSLAKKKPIIEANSISYASCEQWSDYLLEHLVKRGIATAAIESEPAKVIRPSQLWSVDEKGVKSDHISGMSLVVSFVCANGT